MMSTAPRALEPPPITRTTMGVSLDVNGDIWRYQGGALVRIGKLGNTGTVTMSAGISVTAGQAIPAVGYWVFSDWVTETSSLINNTGGATAPADGSIYRLTLS